MRSTKRCLHCRLKLRRHGGRWLHETAEVGASCAAYRTTEGVAVEREAWLAFYRERGMVTLPLRAREKRPLHVGWRVPDPDAWVAAPPDANLGVLCGPASGGLVVLDFDTRDALRDAIGMRAEELAIHTLVARTARGWHVYARHPSARTRSPWKGLDVRAEGSMVVAPPSIHPSGVAYEFIHTDAPIASLPLLPIDLVAVGQQDAIEIVVDWVGVEEWISAQAPKLRDSWRALREGAPNETFDRSRADFAIARCLWEAGYSVDEVAAVLQGLPGSKARERGEAYARRTASRAAGERMAR